MELEIFTLLKGDNEYFDGGAVRNAHSSIGVRRFTPWGERLPC